MPRRPSPLAACSIALLVALAAFAAMAAAVRTQKPPLHGQKWMAVTGKPLAAVAGARTFLAGGNAVDAACAMLAATCTLWDTLGWGGETQALVWDPRAGKVTGVNALGTAPAAATPALYRERGYRYPPEYGPLAAVLPGTPGGLFAMLAEWGRLPLAKVLEPAIELADGFPIEAQLAGSLRRHRERLAGWPFSRALFLPRAGEPPAPGELFRQPDLARTLRRLVEAERAALAAGADRRAAILAADELFYRGALARELAAAVAAEGGLITAADLAAWRPRFEPSVATTYRGVEVHKLTVWTQGPALLQALNLLEQEDLKSMGYNSARYLHTVAQAMHMAFADRDFYYGDPAFPPEEPVAGLLSKGYARERWTGFDPARNRTDLGPGDPYPFQGGSNPFAALLQAWRAPAAGETRPGFQVSSLGFDEAFRAGTTSVVAADAEGWVVSMTPSGAWVPAVVAGATGIGLSQRMQSFVLDGERRPLQRARAGQAAARDADADARARRRQALARLRRPGRRHAGPEPAAVLPRRRRVRHDAAGGGRGREREQLPDAQLLRRARERAGAADAALGPARVGARRAPAHGLPARLRRAHLRAGHRDPDRPGARHALGRGVELRRGHGHRMVNSGVEQSTRFHSSRHGT